MIEMNLTKNIAIILAMIERPLGSARILRDNLSSLGLDISISTINRRLKRIADLDDPEINPNSNSKNSMITGVEAVIDYHSLQMCVCTIMVIPSENNWERNISILRQLCMIHPYTLYYNKIFGEQNAVLLQFAIPEDNLALKHLEGVFEYLIKKQVISSYKLYQFDAPPITLNTDLTKWDEVNNNWMVDFNEIRMTLMNPPSKNIENNPKSSSDLLRTLNMFDMVLIREMTKNARIRQQQLLKNLPKNKFYSNYNSEFPKSKQSMSGRIKNLKENGVFRNYRLLYDSKLFSMFNQALYIIEFEGKDQRDGLINCLRANFLPFQGSLSISGNTGFFWVNLPPREMADLTEVFVDWFPRIKYYLFGNTQMKFYFWHENFDEYTRYWKNDNEYMVSTPIESLEQLFSHL